MRVALVASPWLPVPPTGYGGTELMLDSLATGLVARGHDVLLVTTGDSSCDVTTSWVVPEALGTNRRSTANEVRHVVHAYDVIREWGADIVHDHTLIGPEYGQRFGVPVVTTSHLPFDHQMERHYRSIADAVPIIAISHHQAASASDIPIAGVIHHGIDMGALPWGSGDGGHALFLARMSPEKGPDTAIRAARKAGMPLKMAAKLKEPEERRYFDEHIAPLLGGGVEYVGEVGGRDKLELLAGATCLLHPVRWAEPFGIAMIEALGCGTPVIATPRGSIPELIRSGVTGFVRSGVEGLADALRRVGELDRATCRRTAVAAFSTERMVADHVALYRRVLSARSR